MRHVLIVLLFSAFLTALCLPAYAEDAAPAAGSAQEGQSAPEDDITKAQSEYFLGMMMVSHGRYESARDSFEEAVRLNPKHYDSYVMLAKMYTRTKQHPSSVQTLRDAINLDPSRSEAYDDLMVLYLYLRQPPKAVKIGEMALGNGIPEEALPDLGWAYYQSDMPDKAEAVYLRALERDPDAYGVNRNLGILCFSRGEYERARKYYDKAAEKDPKNSKLPYLMAVNYQMLDMETSAWKSLRVMKGRESKLTSNIGDWNRTYFPHMKEVVSLNDYIYSLRRPKPDKTDGDVQKAGGDEAQPDAQ